MFSLKSYYDALTMNDTFRSSLFLTTRNYIKKIKKYKITTIREKNSLLFLKAYDNQNYKIKTVKTIWNNVTGSYLVPQMYDSVSFRLVCYKEN